MKYISKLSLSLNIVMPKRTRSGLRYSPPTRKRSRYNLRSTPVVNPIIAARRGTGRSRVRMSTNLHHFQRWTQAYTYQIANPLTQLAFVNIFRFQDLVNYSEFSNLYDRYMITGVMLKFQLINNPDANNEIGTYATGNAANWFPKMWYIKDYDDGNTENLDAFRQRAGVRYKILKPNSEVKIFVKPAILTQQYASAVSTGYTPKWRQWVDMDNPSVPHYGVKCIIDTNGVVPTVDHPFYVRAEARFMFSCKDVR